MTRFFSTLWRKITGRYEGGQRWSPNRSFIPAFVQDARFDADACTREELVRKSRYFERNNAIVNRLADLFEQFTVGPNGLQFIPSTDDEEWNTAAKAWFDQWCKVCDLTSLHSFGTLQSLAARCWFIDGEVFILKTKGEKRENGQPTLRPRIQLIEAHRVETPPELYQRKDIIDGVQIDKRGRPVVYWVRNTSAEPGKEPEYEPYSAEQIIHIFEPSRPGQYRGLPFLYPVINDLHDLDDLQILEMDAAKEHAHLTNVITTQTGEAPSAASLYRQKITQTSQDTQGNNVDADRMTVWRRVTRAASIFLKKGEDVKQLASQRPSVAAQNFWDYMAWKICAGVGISKLLVFPVSIQGTVARADNDVSNAFFRSRSAVLATAFGRVFEWVIDWATRNDVSVSEPPADWRQAYSVCAPRSVNVDVGRNSTAMINELRVGATTFDEVYGPLGADWKIQLRKRAAQAFVIKKLAKEFSKDGIEVKPEDISDLFEPESTEEQAEPGRKPPVYAS